MLFRIIILILLIILNGIFSGSELAFLSLNKVKLQEDVLKKDKKAIEINRIIKNPSAFLSTIQIGITLAGFLASAFAADYFADYFINFLKISFVSEAVIRSLLVILITLLTKL